MDYKQKGKLDEYESSTKSTGYPGLWKVPFSERCCIYRVPERLRKVNPDAYTPQLVLIGPLQQSLRAKAFKSFQVSELTNTKFTGYVNTENHKEFYLAAFAQRFKDKNIIDGFRGLIVKNEKEIRESYSESTDWIESPQFVEMILRDSVFIFEFIMRTIGFPKSERGRDPLIDELCHKFVIVEDLILLENQLPFFILEKIFGPILDQLFPGETFRELMITFFQFEIRIGHSSELRHFTDLMRCFYVKTPPQNALGDLKLLEHIYNAEKLHNGGG